MDSAIIVIFGASGDLACKKVFPALWSLFKNNQINPHYRIIGYARTKKSINEFVDLFKKYCKVTADEEITFTSFMNILTYHSGEYQDDAFIKFGKFLKDLFTDKNDNRIYYFALPPSVYTTVAKLTKNHCHPKNGYVRVVLEKPFGYDLESALTLNKDILEIFKETEIYRIDHYLGKEMVQNILAIRFANSLFSSLWNKEHISNIMISFKEDIGTDGRANYYDGSGVIRDVIQNHMIQVVSILAMEQPISLSHNDVKDAKRNVLKQFVPIDLKNVVVGQYVGDPSAPSDSQSSKGYKDDASVPNNSITPTYANIVLYIDNERWRGVPFIMKAGKALRERKSEIRVQFKSLANKLFEKEALNELIIRMQPDEAIYLKVHLKMPGPGFHLNLSELDMTYKDRHKEFKPQEAYEKLILDVINGAHNYFVRSDEVEESWKLISPLISALEKSHTEPIKYVFKSRGPIEADALNEKVGFKYDPSYKWSK